MYKLLLWDYQQYLLKCIFLGCTSDLLYKTFGQGAFWELAFYASTPSDPDAQSGLETPSMEGTLVWTLNDSGMTPIRSVTQLFPLVLSVPICTMSYQVAAQAPFGFEALYLVLSSALRFSNLAS